MAYKKDDKNAPAWARCDGDKYKSEFFGTAEQKKEHDKVVAEMLSKAKKRGSK